VVPVATDGSCAVSWFYRLQPGQPSGLIWAESTYISPLSFVKATRQLTACVSKHRTSPVTAVAQWTVTVTWLLFIEVLNLEETECPS